MTRGDRSIRIAAIALTGVIGAVFLASYIAMNSPAPQGLEEMTIHFIGVGLLIVAAWLGVLAWGVWRRRTWAQVAALLTYGPMAIVSLLLSIDVVRRVQTQPGEAPARLHLIAPAVVTICAGAIAALVAASVRASRDTRPEDASNG